MGGVRRVGWTRPLRRRTAPTALAALALVAALAACGDDDPDSPGASGTPGSSESDEPTEPTESTESTEPTEPTEPVEPETPLGTGVAPATGKKIVTEGLTLRLPVGWRTTSQDEEGFVAVPRDYNLDVLELITIQNSGLTSPPAAAYRDYKQYGVSPPKTLPPIEVDGVPMFHGAGQTQPATWVEAFGSNSTEYSVWLTFESSPDLTTLKERRELADSVLATVDLVE